MAGSDIHVGQPLDAELDGNGVLKPSPPRRKRRPGAPTVLAVLVLVVVAAGLWLLLRDGTAGAGEPDASAVSTSTARVERRDLVETESVDGTLGYAGSRAVAFLRPGVAGEGSGGIVSEDDRSTNTASSTAGDAGGGRSLIAYRTAQVADESTGDPATEDDPTDSATAGTTTEPGSTAPTETAPEEGDGTGGSNGEGSTDGSTEQPAEGSSSGGGDDSTTGTDSTTDAPTAGTGGPLSGGSGSVAAASGGSGAASGTSSGSAATASRPDTVTWLPTEGQTLERGDVLYRVNGKATYLMDGETPTYRTLAVGVANGNDVTQLERNLVAMGFDKRGSMSIDAHFGEATNAAVKRWQKAIGVKQTGVVKLGTVLFLPGSQRVGTVDVAIGDQVQSGATMMTTTSIEQIVTVALETTDQRLVAEGDSVTVELPDGSPVPGTVASIGTVATSSSDSSDTGGQGGGQQQASSDATVEMVITLDETSGVDLDQAPVDVNITQESATNVLAVPVSALLALSGGGYALEVVDGPDATHLVRVEPGLYADGYVEVTGDGIAEGTEIVVAG